MAESSNAFVSGLWQRLLKRAESCSTQGYQMHCFLFFLILSYLYCLLFFVKSIACCPKLISRQKTLLIQNVKILSSENKKVEQLFLKRTSFNLCSSLCKLVPYLNLSDWEQCPPPALTVDIKQQRASAWSELQNACSKSCLVYLVTSIDMIFGGNLVFGFTYEHVQPVMWILETWT